MAEHFGRFGDGAHGVDDAQHRGDDPEGGNAVGDDLDGIGDSAVLPVMGFEFLVDEVAQLVGVVGAQGHQAQIVAEEGHRVVVAIEFGKLLEERAFLGLLDMLLEGEQALGFGNLEHLEKQGQQLQIMLFAVFRPLHEMAEFLAGLTEDDLGVGGEVATGGGPEDDQEFERLPQHGDVAVVQNVTTEDAEHDNGVAGEH